MMLGMPPSALGEAGLLWEAVRLSTSYDFLRWRNTGHTGWTPGKWVWSAVYNKTAGHKGHSHPSRTGAQTSQGTDKVHTGHQGPERAGRVTLALTGGQGGEEGLWTSIHTPPQEGSQLFPHLRLGASSQGGWHCPHKATKSWKGTKAGDGGCHTASVLEIPRMGSDTPTHGGERRHGAPQERRWP
jgi:hypothetical protein